LQHALVGQDWGDMPHNWASAECVRYLRHMLALEDGTSLRLLNGITAAELKAGARYSLKNSPTRFGRINLDLEPAAPKRWRLVFHRGDGPQPSSISLPQEIGRLAASGVKGAGSKVVGRFVEIDPSATEWELLLA